MSCSAPTLTSADVQRVLVEPWAMHVITAGAPTGPFRGADGVDLVGDRVATAWEQGGLITVAHRPAEPTEPWPTEVVATHVFGVEDAKLGDLDGDDVLDVVSASDDGQRVYVSFGQATTPWPTITIAASLGHHRVMQVALADMDRPPDGRLDIVFGTRAGTAADPAVVAWLKNPGAGARNGAAWTYHPISLAGWIMSIVPLDVDGDGDMDVVVSDRTWYPSAADVRQWDLYGARWEEQTPAGWGTHPISAPAGKCPACTQGDEMMLAVADWDGDGELDVVDGTSQATHVNRIAIHRNLGGWRSWGQELVPTVTGVGHYQAVAVGDIDHDGRPDLVVSTWEVSALPSSPLTGVYWLRNTGTGWERGEISGPLGSKFDNVVLADIDGDGWLDVVDSEQVDNLGVVWYRNPGWP